MEALFPIAFLIFFWWALFVGAKALLRRFFGMFRSLLGAAPDGPWDAGEARRLSRAVDDQQTVTLASLVDEMETTLSNELDSAAELIAEASERQRLLADAERAMASWDEKARAAIAAGRDELARAALGQRQMASQRAEALRDEIARINELLRGYQSDIRRLRDRLEKVYRRQSHASSRINRAELGARAHELLEGANWEDASPELESLDREADLAEARLEVLSLGERRNFGRRNSVSGIAQALRPIEAADPEIERQLAAIKAKLASKANPPAAA